MSDAPEQGELSRHKLVRRSNKNYDELIRDYIRVARERLEAAKRSPLPTGVPHVPVTPTQQTPSDTKPQHAHSISTAIALPSPSAQWPLPGLSQQYAPENPPAVPSTQGQERVSIPPGASTTVDFNGRPVQVLATVAPQLAPKSPTNPSAQPHHRRTPSSFSHSRNHSVPTIHEGYASHAHTPSRISAVPSVHPPGYDAPSESQYNHDDDDHIDNPFADHNDRGLVREASIGRSHKPVLTDIVNRSSQERRRSADESRRLTGAQTPITPGLSGKDIRAGVGVTDVPTGRLRSSSLNDRVAFRSGTVLLTPTASIISDHTVKADFVPSSIPGPSSKSEVETTYRPGTAQSHQSSSASFRLGTLPATKRQTSLSERVGSKRPPRLNLDAVKEAESRGSMSSLPDLISRALRLASNLERGKSANKAGIDGLGNENNEKAPAKQRRGPFPLSGSLPSLPASGGDACSRIKDGWQRSTPLRSNLRKGYSQPPSADPEKTKPQQRRRCCGMPIWLFALTVAFVFVLVVAAILVPIFIIVIPEEARTTDSCANGGVSVVSAMGNQQCICVDGYTGITCRRDDESGCTSYSLETGTNATVGLQLPAVLAKAVTDYDINLNATVLLSLFSTLDMTCASETSLISLTGVSARSNFDGRLQLNNRLKSTPTISGAPSSITVAPNAIDLRPRQTQAVTVNGIVFAQSSSSTSSSTPSTTTSSQPTATSSASSSFNATSEYTLGFARTAILYILQDAESLAEAQSAHSKLYLFLANPSAGDAADVDLGSGWSVNLEKGTLLHGEGKASGN